MSRSKLGAISASARMILQAKRSIADSDLIHLHSNGLLIEAAAWLAARFRKPYVITLYGTDVSAHDAARNARYGGVVREAAVRVFYSRGLLDHASRVGLARDPSRVIYAPVSRDFHSVDARARAELRRELAAGDGPVLLTVKHLRPVCGHDTLLHAMPAILARHPTAALWLAGDGDMRPSLEAMSRELGIADRVRFLGRVGNDMLWKYDAAADVFVLPSHVESWGTVMLESMACGTPVVTTDTVGGREVHEIFAEDVVVVPRQDPHRLAEGVLSMLTSPRRVSTGTLDRIRRDFSVQACAAQYLDVYRQALSAPR